MNALMVLGLICLGLSLIFSPEGPFKHLKSTFPQVYTAYREGKLPRTPLPVRLLGLLGIVLLCCGFWRQWFP
jgi:hypothetical protein